MSSAHFFSSAMSTIAAGLRILYLRRGIFYVLLILGWNTIEITGIRLKCRWLVAGKVGTTIRTNNTGDCELIVEET